MLEESSQVADMARWIAMVTVEANHFDVGDGRFIRDSHAERKGWDAARRGRKRKVERSLPESLTERLLKRPKIAELRQRVLGKVAAGASA